MTDDVTEDPPVTAPDSQWDGVPPDMVSSIELTWKEMTGGFEGKTGARPCHASITEFNNTILDQVMQNNGKLEGYNDEYPQCAGGKDNHYDQSLWLTEGMNGGAGGDCDRWMFRYTWDRLTSRW